MRTCSAGSTHRGARSCSRRRAHSPRNITRASPGRVSTSGSPSLRGSSPPAAWKQNMLVLGLLYPIVFLFGFFVEAPWLEGRAGLPFFLALFIANIVGILLLSYLVPWVSDRLAWWLTPVIPASRPELTGAALMVAMYALCLVVFSRFP